ncbi:MAG: TrbG/VirB9 family P-type conjugative transfer protein [Fusobacterium gastrosuis]|uniref:TrbG/VirB9 family P-type conjugative transfer protein n=1 Tax=Fusobacterium gastrosuis TaxID=1755100 RepID=UPI00297843AE|nr:TrbG/VirB9 family P-type conjugative transfer protein [Fusobacteriaceae bacterium]MDY4011039.1 TrbG/VirB9 family P-type conjugative transfer protein [Fusobacterium gastrosuis]MDY5714129.1 TrbG/VirB9 family P-type conjugative transfer protein [Fusobacterium gastrosuis]
MKKYLIFLTLILSSIFSYSDEINLYKAASRKEPINIPYKKGDTYHIYTKPLHQTVITFGDEIVEYSETGDNISFHTVSDKYSVRLKSIDEGLATDLVVKTNNDIYYFKVKSTYDAYNPMINFLYPQKENLKRRHIERTTEIFDVINLAEINNNYSISKKYNWTPVQIMDDGNKTVFFMSHKMQELPALMLKTEDGKFATVTPIIKGTGEKGATKLIVINRIFKEAVLQLGDKKVLIKNKNFSY